MKINKMFWKQKCFYQAKEKVPFSSEALTEYLDAFSNPEMIYASCEDYRAAASIDIEHDNADLEKKLEMPILTLWAKHGVIETCFNVCSEYVITFVKKYNDGRKQRSPRPA